MTRTISVALVGAGAMGGALLKGWLEKGDIDAERSSIFDPNPGPAVEALVRAHRLDLNPPPAKARADALVLAIKPQSALTVLPSFAPLASEALAISVMAGVGLETIGRLLGSRRLCRAMPNLPAQIGKGISGLFAPEGTEPADRALAGRLLAAVGETVFVRSEREIDLVTAVSGSGPAYFFLMAEALAEAGVRAGLDADAAARLARATATGMGALLAADPRPAGDLRRAVTSPGGTTEAALRVLDGAPPALRQLMIEAVAAAARRAGQLSS